MTTAQFFEKFDLFADAPDAVDKMRELTLHLAVMGKLTEGDPKREAVAPKYTDEPVADFLPSNWRLLNFGKFCDIQGGNQPPKSEFSDKPKPGYVRLFQIRDLGEKPSPVYISEESTNRFCREGEILIGRYGASVGKVFWAQDGAYNVALAKFIFPEDALVPAFAFWVLKSDFFQAKVAGASRSAQAGFNKGDLAAIDFPLPPLAEQKRIVAKVDELMALCDQLEAQQQERESKHTALTQATLARFAEDPTPTNLNLLFHSSFSIQPSDLRKTILTLAVHGSLSASSSNWKATTLQEVSLLITDGEHATPARTPKGIPMATAKNVRDGFLDLTVTDFVAPSTAEKCWRRCKPSDGDILMVCVGATTGRVCRVSNPPDMVLVRSVALLRPDQTNLSSDFLDVFLRSPTGQKQIWAGVKQNAQPCLYLSKMKAFQMLLPPLAEQKRIVAKVEELMALVDALEAQQAAADQAATHLLDAVVSELAAA